MTDTKKTPKPIADPEQPGKSHWSILLIKWTAISMAAVFILFAGAMAGLFFYMGKDLPRINTLEDYQPSTVTNIFSDDGRKIGEFYKERRIVIPLSEMPEQLVNAFIAAEDSRFREHAGIRNAPMNEKSRKPYWHTGLKNVFPRMKSCSCI